MCPSWIQDNKVWLIVTLECSLVDTSGNRGLQSLHPVGFLFFFRTCWGSALRCLIFYLCLGFQWFSTLAGVGIIWKPKIITESFKGCSTLASSIAMVALVWNKFITNNKEFNRRGLRSLVENVMVDLFYRIFLLLSLRILSKMSDCSKNEWRIEFYFNDIEFMCYISLLYDFMKRLNIGLDI